MESFKTLKELNNLYYCFECMLWTPRSRSTCVGCEKPLPSNEVINGQPEKDKKTKKEES